MLIRTANNKACFNSDNEINFCLVKLVLMIIKKTFKKMYLSLMTKHLNKFLYQHCHTFLLILI